MRFGFKIFTIPGLIIFLLKFGCMAKVNTFLVSADLRICGHRIRDMVRLLAQLGRVLRLSYMRVKGVVRHNYHLSVVWNSVKFMDGLNILRHILRCRLEVSQPLPSRSVNIYRMSSICFSTMRRSIRVRGRGSCGCRLEIKIRPFSISLL